jgi:hypothetical protein
MAGQVKPNLTDSGSGVDDGRGVSRAGVVGGGVLAGAVVLVAAVGLGVYRYRHCYDGTYVIDTETAAANGYAPCRGEGRPMSRMNGAVRPTSPVHRPNRELYV